MMLAIAVLLAAQAEPVAATTAYPATEVLTAFSRACATLDSLDAARGVVEAEGWTPFEPDPESRFGRLIALGQDMADAPFSGASYRRDVAGRSLELHLSEVEIEGMFARGCRIYDFAATERLPADAIAQWAGRERTSNVALDGMMVSDNWEPGLITGHYETQVAFVPHESPLAESMGLTGINLMTGRIDLIDDDADSIGAEGEASE